MVYYLTEVVLPIDITKDEAWELYGKLKIHEAEKEKSNKHLLSNQKASHEAHALRNLTVETEFTNFQHFVVYLPIYFSSVEYSGKIYEVHPPPSLFPNEKTNLPGLPTTPPPQLRRF